MFVSMDKGDFVGRDAYERCGRAHQLLMLSFSLCAGMLAMFDAAWCSVVPAVLIPNICACCSGCGG